MIQALIPLGLQAVEDALPQEVLALAGLRYAHADGRPAIARWGAQAGSVFLADQQVPIRVPRVRNRATNTEVPLATSAQLQTPRGQDVGGLVQTATENKRVCAAFLRELVARGFQTPAGLLVVLDGAKGLSAAVRDVFGERVPIQRCQWHKRENVLRYLPKTQHALWRRKLQAAYAKATYGEAQRALRQLVKELEQSNASAARSLNEGLDETLTLHRLEVLTKLGLSFKTTNLIERVMARVEAKVHRVTHWRTSDQQQRWCAATLLEIEKQFRKVKGHQHLGLLQAALRGKLLSSLAAA